jgi:hypothetical protein
MLAGRDLMVEELELCWVFVMLVMSAMEICAILIVLLDSVEMVLSAGRIAQVDFLILEQIAWSLLLMEEELDTRSLTRANVSLRILKDVSNMEPCTIQSALRTSTPLDAVSALQTALPILLTLEFHARREATEEEQELLWNVLLDWSRVVRYAILLAKEVTATVTVLSAGATVQLDGTNAEHCAHPLEMNAQVRSRIKSNPSLKQSLKSLKLQLEKTLMLQKSPSQLVKSRKLTLTLCAMPLNKSTSLAENHPQVWLCPNPFMIHST